MILIKDNSSNKNKLILYGLSINHNQLPKDIQDIEQPSKKRRAQPLFPSEVLGDSYQYSEKQLIKKLKHLSDYGL